MRKACISKLIVVEDLVVVKRSDCALANVALFMHNDLVLTRAESIVVLSFLQSATRGQRTPDTTDNEFEPKSSLDSQEISRLSPGSLAKGYQQLLKNGSLAGRRSSRDFRREAPPKSPNRLRQVSRLRRKEKLLVWRDIWNDMVRTVSTLLAQYTLVKIDQGEDPAACAIRRFNKQDETNAKNRFKKSA